MVSNKKLKQHPLIMHYFQKLDVWLLSANKYSLEKISAQEKC